MIEIIEAETDKQVADSVCHLLANVQAIIDTKDITDSTKNTINNAIDCCCYMINEK